MINPNQDSDDQIMQIEPKNIQTINHVDNDPLENKKQRFNNELENNNNSKIHLIEQPQFPYEIQSQFPYEIPSQLSQASTIHNQIFFDPSTAPSSNEESNFTIPNPCNLVDFSKYNQEKIDIWQKIYKNIMINSIKLCSINNYNSMKQKHMYKIKQFLPPLILK